MQIHVLFILAQSAVVAAGLSCVDESGAGVDWWFMVKHPVAAGAGSGTDYVFATSKDASALSSSSKQVTDADSLLGKQLAGIYSGSAPNYVVYNDQTPDGKYSTDYGHSKGFFAYDNKSGFWVQHSVPHFPNYVKDGYLYGHGQEMYGQHAFCMTVPPDSINDLASVMKYSNGWIYDHKTDGTLSNVEDIVNGKTVATGTVVKDVTTAWGTLKLMGKTVAFNQDMLQQIVAPTLKQNMLYQSWLNTGGKLGPYCPSSGFDVFDITSLHISSSDTHDTHNDHSKWAVSKATSSTWVCGVDNNHVESQYKRSGLAVCIENESLSRLMRATAAETNTCEAPSPSPGPSPPSPPSPSPPSPSPGKCCYYTASSTACSAGEICCSGSGASYESASTCSRYGVKHNCKWTGKQCIVTGGNASVALLI
jgi:deoxyribonuclease-2